MAVTVNIYYSGNNGNARKFADEMVSTGVVDKIRAEEGNLRYEYFFPMGDSETVLLIDSWKDQHSIDVHHASPHIMQGKIPKRQQGLIIRTATIRIPRKNIKSRLLPARCPTAGLQHRTLPLEQLGILIIRQTKARR